VKTEVLSRIEWKHGRREEADEENKHIKNGINMPYAARERERERARGLADSNQKLLDSISKIYIYPKNTPRTQKSNIEPLVNPIMVLLFIISSRGRQILRSILHNSKEIRCHHQEALSLRQHSLRFRCSKREA
jgi:hypothetical protein